MRSQIGNRAELFNCGVGKRSNKFIPTFVIGKTNGICYKLA
ncbi:MAG: hypothetical protein ACR5K9_11100 [Wolbachia sp.]